MTFEDENLIECHLPLKAVQSVAVKPISIEKHKKLIGEEWFIRKPMEVVSRAVITHRDELEEDIAVKMRKLKVLLDEGLVTKEQYEEKEKNYCRNFEMKKRIDKKVGLPSFYETCFWTV